MSAAETSSGLVVAGHGRHYVVESPHGERITCHTRGKRSDCVVGDHVAWQRSGDEGVIERVEPRRNLLFRQDAWKTKSFAANIDQLLLLVAAEPVFSESQLARALMAAEAAGIGTRILLNKTDLPAIDTARTRLEPYRNMGIDVLEASLKGRAADAHALLAPILADRVTLLLGPSGTGKSTLINLMVPQAQAQVGQISQALGTGRHTTTATLWYWLDAVRRGALIDSPGFQEFGLHQIEPQQLPLYMPDLRAHVAHCRFYNCTHRQEPGCGVLEALTRGDVAPSRHRIYMEIRDELERSRW